MVKPKIIKRDFPFVIKQKAIAMDRRNAYIRSKEKIQWLAKNVGLTVTRSRAMLSLFDNENKSNVFSLDEADATWIILPKVTMQPTWFNTMMPKIDYIEWRFKKKEDAALFVIAFAGDIL